jgi:hypothetical protein
LPLIHRLNAAGPGGYAVAHALGFFALHATVYTPHNHMDCVPCDVAANLVLAAAAQLVAESPAAPGNQLAAPQPAPRIYHAASAAVNPLAFSEACAGHCHRSLPTVELGHNTTWDLPPNPCETSCTFQAFLMATEFYTRAHNAPWFALGR